MTEDEDLEQLVHELVDGMCSVVGGALLTLQGARVIDTALANDRAMAELIERCPQLGALERARLLIRNEIRRRLRHADEARAALTVLRLPEGRVA